MSEQNKSVPDKQKEFVTGSEVRRKEWNKSGSDHFGSLELMRTRNALIAVLTNCISLLARQDLARPTLAGRNRNVRNSRAVLSLANGGTSTTRLEISERIDALGLSAEDA